MLEGSQLQAELKLSRLQNHSANLLQSVDFLLRSLTWKLEDINLIASGIGPGSFTGIRIGIATGIGLAQFLSIPFAGVSGLEALAYQVVSLEGSVGVLLNARRGQVYYAEYRNAGGRMSAAKKPSLEFLSDLPQLFKNRRLYLIGDTELCQKDLVGGSTKDWPRIVETDPYLATGIGRRALSSRRRWRSGAFLQCEPLYVRPPDAIKNRDGSR